MQKGKHQGGQTQGFSHRNYPTYPGNPETSRQYTREVPAFHAGGTPGGGPGMRGMHHAPPTQPPTPPTSQDIKQPSHLPPQSHPMPPQSGAQIMQFTMTGAGRSNSQQAQFYNTQRGPSGVQRMAPHPRTPVIMSNNPQPFLHQPAVPPVYQSSLVSPVSGQPPVFVAPHMNQSYQLQAQPRQQGGFYPAQQYVLPPAHHLFQNTFQQMYFSPQIQQMSRPGGPTPNSQATAPHPPPAGMTVITGTTGTLVSPPPVAEAPKPSKRKVLQIIDPTNGRDIMDDIRRNNNAMAKSGESSAKQTPQTNSEQKIDQGVAAEFATRVAIAARSDQSGSPNSPALQQQQQQASSRVSNYSENESQASPDMQGMSTPSVSPSKIDISVESIPSESQIVENNMTYDANQQAAMMRPGWPQVMPPVELMSVPVHSGLIMPEDIMRGGAPPAQPPREYQPMQTQWIPDGNTVPVPLIISKEPSAPMESPVRPAPERVTPVVSALAHGPTVEIAPRHQREQFPALGKGHQQLSPVRRKQRSEVSQDQQGDGKARSSESASSHGPNQGQQPQPQQQPAPKSSGAQQQKPKQSTPTVESKKQSAQPCQDSDDYVQSIQTRNTDSKTVTVKVGDGEANNSKVKTNDGFTSRDDEAGDKLNEKDDVKGDGKKVEVGSTAEVATIEDTSEKNRQRQGEDRELQSVAGMMDGERGWKPNAISEIRFTDVQMDQVTTTTATATTVTSTSTPMRTPTPTSNPIPVPTPAPPPASTPVPAPAAASASASASASALVPDQVQVEIQPQFFGHISSDTKTKTNGEPAIVADDAKQNNQKQKPGNKRQQQQAQSKMKLEKEAWNPEKAEALANEATPTPSVPEAKSPPPPAVENSEQPEGEFSFEMASISAKEREELIVAAKNEENNKQTASVKTNDSTPVIESVNKLLLRRTYKKEQWSPANPDGKKKYDRDFILELKNDPQSNRRPTNFPNLDLWKDNPKQRPSDRNIMNTFRDASDNGLFPSFGNREKSSAQRNSQSLQKKGSQNSKSKVTRPPVIHMSLHQDVKLHETENAWKPSRSANYNNMTDELKTEELYKRVRGILNKLTPEKFNTLVDQIKSLPIDNHARLSGVIDLVFEKAVDEPNFSVAYAQMCNEIENIEVANEEMNKEGKPAMTSFKKLLITRCQLEFEKDSTAEMKRREEKMKEIEKEPDPEKKKYLQLVLEEEERRVRMKSVGNSRFIGELYKLNMLTCKIMHDCIARLLNEGDEESLECLCKLLTTVGRNFEAKALAESKEMAEKKFNDRENCRRTDPYQELNSYFKKLVFIAKNKGSKKVSSRVRFMIQDLIDLRSNKWTPRRDDSNPKTFDQIQREVDLENMNKNLALNSSSERNKRQDSRNSLDNRKRGIIDSSGWTTVPQNRSGRYVIEPSKLKVEQSEIDVDRFSLGTSNQFAKWGQGLGVGKSDSKSVGLDSSNMFAPLNDKISQPSSRNSSLKGSSMSDKDRVLSSYKSNYEDDRRSSRSGSQQGADSRTESRDSISSKHDDRRYMNAGKGDTPNKSSSFGNRPAVTTKSPEAIQDSVKLLLGEYLSCNELEEAEMSAKDILQSCSKADFALYVLHTTMEMNVLKAREIIGKLMNHFLKKHIITKGHLIDGLTNVMEAVDDLALDMPLIWVYLAEMVVRIFAEDILSFRELAELLKPRHGSLEVTKLLSSFFELLIQEKNETWVQERWMLSQVALGDFIKEKDVDNFIKQNKLEFLLKEKDINSLKIDTIKSELYKMIASKTDFDTITAWIDKSVSPERRSKPEFVRTLMTVLLEATVIKVQSSWKLDTDYISIYDQLIVRYTDHSEELELPCLYALQTFLHKLVFPPGLAPNICHYLWDRELIAAESFMLWLNTNEPREIEGHAVCVRSLWAFITALSESMSDDDS